MTDRTRQGAARETEKWGKFFTAVGRALDSGRQPISICLRLPRRGGPMNDDPRLSQLLDRWHELRDGGKPASPAEVCANCPELRPAFEQRLRQIARLDQVARPGLEAIPRAGITE